MYGTCIRHREGQALKATAVIVRKVGADGHEVPDAHLLEEARRIEASLLPNSNQLVMDFPVGGFETRYLRHLEQRIHRNPRDLLSHVRRIVLWRALKDWDGVYGALIDLFLALGYRGRPLRSRLLGLASADLTPEQREFLSDHLEEGLDPDNVGASTARSCLSRHVSGTTSVVAGPQSGNKRDRNLLAVAREALAKGDDATAQSILEGAIEADPGSDEVCLELLALYKRLNLRADFMRTYTMALGRQLARPDLWRAMAARFEKERRHSDEQL